MDELQAEIAGAATIADGATIDVAEPDNVAEPINVTTLTDVTETIDVPKPFEVTKPNYIAEPNDIAEPFDVTEPCEGTGPTVAPESAASGKSAPINGRIDPAFEARRQRILEHRLQAQRDPDTRMAYVAGVVSDLLDTELVIGESLRQGLAAGGGSLENILQHAQLIDVSLRFSKQISQLAQLELRVRSSQAKEESPP